MRKGFLFLILFLFSCEKDAVRTYRPSSVALDFYSKGMYRHSRDTLLDRGSRCSADDYLLARDYQELHEPEKAVEYFEKVDPENLQKTQGLPHPLEHFGAYYIRALFDSSVYYTNALERVSNCLLYIPKESPFREKSESVLYYYLWRDKAYQSLTNLEGDNPTSSFYRMGARVLLGEKKLQEALFLHSVRLPSLFYQRILDQLDVSYFNRTSAIRRVVDEAIRFQKIDLAKKFIERYYFFSRDNDYRTRNLARLDWNRGYRKRALQRLDRLVKKRKASRLTIRLYYRYLKAGRENRKILQLLIGVRRRYPNSFNEWYIRALKKNHRDKELYRWFGSKVSNYYFRKHFSYSLIRYFLFRGKTKTALKMADQTLRRGKSNAIRLIRALLLLDRGETKRAYLDFLHLTLYSPFTYEWLVANRYEARFRESYADLYRKEIKKALSFFARVSLKQKVYYWKGLKETNPLVFERQVGEELYRKKLNDWHDRVRKEFSSDLKGADFRKLESFRLETNREVRGWSHEQANLVKSEIKRLSRLNGVAEYRILYRYFDLLRDLDLEGWALSRLNTAIQSKWGGRKYHAVLPQEFQKILYPVSALSEIRSFSTNERLNDWILSAFREESHFRKRVFSPVGAVGYAQIMPYTAKRLKRNLRRFDLSIYDYRDNVFLGVSLYQYLFKKYKGRVEFALAAYNAGEGAVNRWKKAYSLKNKELWTDCVEYQETRNYIKKIALTFYYYSNLYRHQDHQWISMKLSSDSPTDSHLRD